MQFCGVFSYIFIYLLLSLRPYFIYERDKGSRKENKAFGIQHTMQFHFLSGGGQNFGPQHANTT